MNQTREIATIGGVAWSLEPSGRIVGKMEDVEVQEFWIANPPVAHVEMFTALCELAVAQGLLRRIPIYDFANR